MKWRVPSFVSAQDSIFPVHIPAWESLQIAGLFNASESSARAVQKPFSVPTISKT